MASGAKRNHHLDALRVSAIFLLIPYHASRFIQKGLTDSKIIDGVVWFVHTWHMPLFFAISGYLAAGALRRSTPVKQVQSRLNRLGIPLLIGMLTVVPLANLFVILSAQWRPRAQKLPSDRELELGNIFTLTPRHLWFLAYLLMVSLIVIGLRALIMRSPKLSGAAARGSDWLINRPFAFVPLALATGSILLLKSGWAAGGSVANSLVPVPALLIYYAAFFGFGGLMARRPEFIDTLRRGAWLRLGAGVALAVPVFLLFYNSGDFTGNVGADGTLVESGTPRILGLFAVGIVCWLTLLGTWGAMARLLNSESRVLRYLSDASFWVYLVHIPFLIALQSALAEADVYLPLRWALTVLGTLGLSVGSYALFVRRSAIGRWLHGARPRRSASPKEPSAALG